MTTIVLDRDDEIPLRRLATEGEDVDGHSRVTDWAASNASVSQQEEA